ncbi:MAG: hypothetical protein LBT27_07470 [Prevotellaceae bacterium]|jgi:hypothetical protein|nr:hypothetical protein [Prevotellaceae bacterium]
MKKLLMVAVFVTALFAAQNANGQKRNDDVVIMQTPSLEQSAVEGIIYVIAEVEQTESSPLLLEEGGYISAGETIKETDNSVSTLNSDCYWDVREVYDSYCQAKRIVYTNPCSQRAYVHIVYKVEPNEGYRGSTNKYDYNVWLQKGYSNATLVDCNRSTNVTLSSCTHIKWEGE